MPDTHNTKNFMAHGGNELVIGGKLTILEGATVEGLNPESVITKMANIPDSEASTIAQIKTDFNALLAALKEAGYMEADADPEEGDDDTEDEEQEPENGNGEGGGEDA